MSSAQARAPIFEALLEYASRGITPLHMPAHKGCFAPEGLHHLLTKVGLAVDLPSLDATDNTFHPTGCVAEAQRLAAELHGAADTFYLTGGSTIGVHAMLLAALAPGEKVLLSRHHHMSAFSGLVLSGAVPVYPPARWLSSAGPIPLSASEIEDALAHHPDIRAVFLTQPTYYGVGRELAPMAAICHQRKIPLLVDEAHGAHLCFLPEGQLRSALASDADVVVQSAHKTLGSLVGTAQLHRAKKSLIPAERLQSALNLLQSTSPSYLLLASLDLSRRETARRGSCDFAASAQRASALRVALASIAGITPLSTDRHASLEGCQLDPLRLLVDVSGVGLSGFDVERRLRSDHQIYGEFADRTNVGYALGPVDEPAAYDRLIRAFQEMSAARPAHVHACDSAIHQASPPAVRLAPREAFLRPTRRIPLDEAAGALSGETISVYPPGIPLVCPGEELTPELIDELRAVAAQSPLVFATDPTLRTVAALAG